MDMNKATQLRQKAEQDIEDIIHKLDDDIVGYNVDYVAINPYQQIGYEKRFDVDITIKV